MRNTRYIVAMSLDGYIAGPRGEADWIVPDPEVDFVGLWTQFDTGVMGRKTYDAAKLRLGEAAFSGMSVTVVSRTMKQSDHPTVRVISELTRERVQGLRAQAAKDIWLFGGGELFRSLLEMGEVDGVEVSVMPLLLGDGVKLLPNPYVQTKLKLFRQKIYRSGIVSLAYEVRK
jgi:dihydrofolate reductase